jgi:hypothetical protein
MSLSRFRSRTSLAPRVVLGVPLGLPLVLALVLALGSAAGCGGGGGDSCGPGGAPDSGLVASGGGLALTYGQLRGSPNRDCPSAGAPSGVISLSIDGKQTDAGASGLITLCIGRPDLLASQPLALGAEPATDVHVVDLNGSANGCMLAVDRSQPPGGTVSSTGLCGNGSDAAGFALVLDATLALTRTCGTTVDSVPITLRGRVAVAGP